jgi:hypothetical protein
METQSRADLLVINHFHYLWHESCQQDIELASEMYLYTLRKKLCISCVIYL